MKKYEYLKIGDRINDDTDEMEHRRKWFPIKEFTAIENGHVIEGMKRIRRPIEGAHTIKEF